MGCLAVTMLLQHLPIPVLDWWSGILIPWPVWWHCRKVKVHVIAPGAPIPDLKPNEYWCDSMHDRRFHSFMDIPDAPLRIPATPATAANPRVALSPPPPPPPPPPAFHITTIVTRASLHLLCIVSNSSDRAAIHICGVH